jgi:enoyl-CoA hydratase
MCPVSEVVLTTDAGVATLTLSAPERRNALTPGMARELVEACEAIDADDSVGAVVVRGEGEGFCSGAARPLLAAIAESPLDDDALHSLLLVYEAFGRVARLQPPTIAAVRGAAVGAGINLALSTDLRIAAEDARFVAGFLRIGVHPGGGHFTLLARLAGREAAAALALFGEEVDGRRAVELGLAWQAVPGDEVDAAAHELAARAARDPALARRGAQTMRAELDAMGLPVRVALQAELANQLWSLQRSLGPQAGAQRGS